MVGPFNHFFLSISGAIHEMVSRILSGNTCQEIVQKMLEWGWMAPRLVDVNVRIVTQPHDIYHQPDDEGAPGCVGM